MELVITVSSITIRLFVIYRMPPGKSNNGLKQGTFCNEFNDYLEKPSCMNCNILIVGDFNIHWLILNGSERKPICNIFETFGFVQNMCTETNRRHHLLEYLLSLERIVILCQTSPSRTLFLIIEHFTFRCNVYVFTLFRNR